MAANGLRQSPRASAPGFAEEFRDGELWTDGYSSNQVGHFLTAVGLAYGTVMTDDEARRCIIGHEKIGDGDYLHNDILTNLKQCQDGTTEQDLDLFEQASLADLAHDASKRDCLIEAILSDIPEHHRKGGPLEATRRGNSRQDLRLSIKGYIFGQKVRDREIISLNGAQAWLHGSMLASGSDDGTVRVWQTATGALRQILSGHNDYITSVAFSPDGQTLAAASANTTIRLWRMRDGALLLTLTGHLHEVESVAFSPDGRLIASAGRDDTIHLWDTSDGRLQRTLEEHGDFVNSVAFSPDGRFVASGGGADIEGRASRDNSVRLWRVQDGALVATFSGHTRAVNSVTFSPDGTMLASGSYDGTVRFWPVKK